MSELTKAVICGHSLYWTTAYNNCVMCENATLRARCEAAEKLVVTMTEQYIAERTTIADLTAKLAAMTAERDTIAGRWKEDFEKRCELEGQLATAQVENVRLLAETVPLAEHNRIVALTITSIDAERTAFEQEIARLKEEVEKWKDQLTHKHPTW